MFHFTHRFLFTFQFFPSLLDALVARAFAYPYSDKASTSAAVIAMCLLTDEPRDCVRLFAAALLEHSPLLAPVLADADAMREPRSTCRFWGVGIWSPIGVVFPLLL